LPNKALAFASPFVMMRTPVRQHPVKMRGEAPSVKLSLLKTIKIRLGSINVHFKAVRLRGFYDIHAQRYTQFSNLPWPNDRKQSLDGWLNEEEEAIAMDVLVTS
jgi:hypothetical protein